MAAALLLPTAAHATEKDRSTLDRYATATWASFVAMTDPMSGLPTDVLRADGTRVPQTSTTNIGAYMWSAVAANRLGLIHRAELVSRIERTLSTLERMERFEGQFIAPARAAPRRGDVGARGGGGTGARARDSV